MYNKKMIAMMLTLSMLAASLAGCAGGDDDDTSDWAISMASDVEVVWVESGWDPIIPNLNAGEMCDVIISAMTKTDERDQVVDFTRAYYTSSQGVIGGSGAASITAVADLNAAGTTIGVQSGTTSDLYANENLGMATISAFEDFPSVITALNNGDVMYAMGDAPVLSLEGTLMVTFSDENFGFAVREDSGELLDALNMAIGAVVDSGEYDTIYGASFDGAVTLADDTTADTATAYPASPSEGSTLTGVLESGQLKVCTDPFYPPFESYDADNNVVGFDADMAHAVVDEIAAHYMGTANPVFVAPAAPATTIKIGAMYDSTGGIANFAPGFEYATGAAINALNAMGDDYVFELVYGDTGCDGTTAGTSAQSLVDSGVVAVAGAACSGASIGANAVLSAAGIPMISFASTSPALSDATAYPHFFRVVPSDAIQGEAMSDMVGAAGVTSPALLHMVNAYGAGLADSFKANWEAAGNTICTQAGYDETTLTDASSIVQGVIDAGTCDSVVLIAYNTDAALILETMAGLGATLPVFGSDGFAGEAALESFNAPEVTNGVQNTKPRAASGSGDFAATCAADTVCSAGIFTSEAYDAVMMIGHAAMMEDGANMATHINMVGSGDGYAGASGNQVFLSNGDVGGSGYDVCTFHHVPTFGQYFNCDRMWTATGGLADVAFAGTTVKLGFMGDATSPAIGDFWVPFQAAAGIGLSLANTIAYSNGVQFEIVYGDTACDGTTAATAAQSLVDAGVWGVVGAACSGASIGANAVLSAAGIPMISYASTSPALSDDTAYPDFFRVVPSDAGQGMALSDLLTANGESTDGVALIHMVNAYGAGLADSFKTNWEAAGNTLCTQVGYDETTTTDYSSVIQAVTDNMCTSVVAVSYNSDGGMIIGELAGAGFTGQIYGTDGIAETAIGNYTSADNLNGVIATKPAAAAASEVSQTFDYLCATTPPCGQGIFTAEAFDALTMLAFSAFTYLTTPGITPSQAIAGTAGAGWNGASGTITFMPNGDTPGSGYCIGSYTGSVAADGTESLSFDCNQHWGANGITDL
ncbi:MAG: ABC transporter substrate-binding protein [Candidatus Poseidoniales archaeon]